MLAKRKGVVARRGLKEAWSKAVNGVSLALRLTIETPAFS